jgi:hypothetical protein
MTNEQIEKLERLAKLRLDGLLTDEEFQTQKQRLLKNADSANVLEDVKEERDTNLVSEKDIRRSSSKQIK